MAVAVDAASVSNTTDAQQAKSWSHTCSGSDRLLIVTVMWNDSNGTDADLTSVTYNSVAMTAVGATTRANTSVSGVDRCIRSYYLVAPATGSNTVAVTMNQSGLSFGAAAVSYTGVNQIIPLGTQVVNSTTSSVTTLACTVSSATGNMVHSGIANRNTGTVTTPTTQQWNFIISTNNRYGGAATAGGASVTCTYSWSTGFANQAMMAVDIKASVTVTKTQTATARIANNPTKTQPATARIATNLTKTQSAVARIANVTTKTQPAIARVAVTVTATQGATARIVSLISKTQPATARISNNFTKTQGAVARVANVRTATQPAVARIARVVTKTQTAIARIRCTVTATQPATARVATNQTKTQPAVARVATNRSATISATARIIQSGSNAKTQPATARIAVNLTKTQGAVARIANSRTVQQNAVARIAIIRTKTQGAVGRIAKTLVLTQPATARIARSRSASQLAVARIARRQTITQTATALIIQGAQGTKGGTLITDYGPPGMTLEVETNAGLDTSVTSRGGLSVDVETQ